MKEYECENCLNTEYIQDKLSESYRNGYNKAIDDFAEKLCNEVESFTATVDGIELDFVSLDYLIEFAYEVSKQLKSRTKL